MRLGYDAQVNERAERLIWLDVRVLDKLTALRGPDESYSDVIILLAAVGRDPLNGS
jgi:hypothetical protein